VKDDGKPRQKNQGKWPFNLEEGVGTVTLTLSIGRFMRMENIQIDVHTSHIHMALKVWHSFATLHSKVLPEDVYTDVFKHTMHRPWLHMIHKHLHSSM
jgi:hypothetical protein